MMSDDTRDKDPATTNPSINGANAVGTRTKLPKGIVLGKDGKP
jgi:hypothetical protein